MTLFDVLGPIDVPCYQGVAGRVVEREAISQFWGRHRAHARRKGCYVFGIRAGRGHAPICIGKATRFLQQECFTHQKLEHYNRALADYRKGGPVLFFVAAPVGKGRLNERAISEIERYLIALGEAANPALSIVQGRARDDWGIRGIVRSGKGKPGRSAFEFRRLMDL